MADRVANVNGLGAESQNEALGEIAMNSLRKKSGRSNSVPEPQECEVNYSGEVTKDQVEKLRELVKSEFETGKWVTVAGKA